VIKPPMDVGTVVNRLKRGLNGSVRDLLFEVELFMANTTRSISPPAAVEGGDLLPMDLEPLHRRHLRRGRRRRSQKPEKELVMASIWPVPDALGGCSDAADAAVGGGAGLGAMPTSGGAVRKDGDTRRDRAHIQRLPAVPSQVPAQPVVEAAKERRGHGPQEAGLE
jgi:hypothetical protein